MKKNQFFTILFFFGITMLIILILSVELLLHSVKKKEAPSADSQTEYIYVYVTDEEKTDSESQAPSAVGWIVKAYAGQIGIFQMDGTLIQIIETHIKTLPRADQDLLEEGIYAMTERELRALIEDYTD